MAKYESKYTGAEIDEAVEKALSASGGGTPINTDSMYELNLGNFNLNDTEYIVVGAMQDDIFYPAIHLVQANFRGKAFGVVFMKNVNYADYFAGTLLAPDGTEITTGAGVDEHQKELLILKTDFNIGLPN